MVDNNHLNKDENKYRQKLSEEIEKIHETEWMNNYKWHEHYEN